MIAADTSSIVAYLTGAPGPDVEALDQALATHILLLPPAVLVEILSEPTLSKTTVGWLRQLPLLDMKADFWARAGLLRAKVLSYGRKARLGDTLIAQSCLDHDVALISRDKDFDAFRKYARLKLWRT